MEDAGAPNDEDINDEIIIIDDDDSLASIIEPPPQTKFWRFKGWTMKMKEWTQKIKKWKMKFYPSRKKNIANGILPPLTTVTEEIISAPWSGTTLLLSTMLSTML